MILRRIIAHVRKQEWTAIAIDFVIVVAGVFVATQVTDWNNARQARVEYRGALERLNAEVTANIEIMDRDVPEIEEAVAVANRGLDALRSCQDSAANRDAINAGLIQIRGTNALRLRTRALQEMVTNPALLAQQSDAEREHFSALSDYTELFAEELRFYEQHPLAQRIEDIPILSIGELRTTSFLYYGVEYQVQRRPMALTVPVSQACRNTDLIAAFFTWTRWQGNIPVLSRQAQQEMEATRAFIAERQ